RRADGGCPMKAGRDVWWDEVVETRPGTLEPGGVAGGTPYLLGYTAGATGEVWGDEVVETRPGTLEPVEVESETPYLLAYTSGTTGKPKGALHVQGGFLLSIVRETAYQDDLRACDRGLF